MGPARYDWLAGVAIVGILIVATRAFTQPATNINLAFSAWRKLGPVLDLPELHVLALLAFWTCALWSSQYGLRRLRLIPKHD